MNTDEHWLLPIIAKKRTDIFSRCIRLLLLIPALVYRQVVNVRNWAYDQQLFSVHVVSTPVISVGNLTTGGTGKTPVVMWLIEHLETDHNVAVVSRGYRSLPGSTNDEGLEIARRFPTVVQIQNKDRVTAAQHAVAELSSGSKDCSVIVLDDGFQHRRLHRDLDIVLLDATLPFGYGKLLPSGLLREPAGSLQRATAVMLTRANLVSAETRRAIKQQVFDIKPDVVWSEAELVCQQLEDVTGQCRSIESLKGMSVLAFCGIGNPLGFAGTLEQEGLQAAAVVTFPDHHHYTQQDLQDVMRQSKQNNCEAIVCTAKDIVKLPADYEFDVPVYALQTKTKITIGASQIGELVQQLVSPMEISRDSSKSN